MGKKVDHKAFSNNRRNFCLLPMWLGSLNRLKLGENQEILNDFSLEIFLKWLFYKLAGADIAPQI